MKVMATGIATTMLLGFGFAQGVVAGDRAEVQNVVDQQTLHEGTTAGRAPLPLSDADLDHVTAGMEWWQWQLSIPGKSTPLLIRVPIVVQGVENPN